MRYLKSIFAILLIFVTISSCRQVKELKNLSKCEFRIKSVENISASNVKVQKLKDISDLSFMDAAKITTGILSGTLPLSADLNVEVRNPNKGTAALTKLDWIVMIDDYEIANGIIDKRIEIPGGGTAIMPIHVQTDLKKIISKDSGTFLVNFAFNLVDKNDKPTRISIKAKPTLKIGKSEITYPNYILVKDVFTSN
ncbi:MAG: LEA type 2 family protein [Bacteroidetes bacterium]|nr:LEA type 2 family protein [Bacteroidota bacterium]